MEMGFREWSASISSLHSSQICHPTQSVYCPYIHVAEAVSSPVTIINTLKKSKLDIEFQSFFLFHILLQKFTLILKCCIILWLEIFGQKEIYILLNKYMYSNSKFTGAYFCLLIQINVSWVPDINFATISGQYFLKAVNIVYWRLATLAKKAK